MSSSFDTYSLDDDDYSYSAAAPPPPFTSDEVTVDHVSSPDPYGFGSDPNAGYSETTPFESSMPVSNGNGNGYDLGDDAGGIFSSDGPVLPPPADMVEEGAALRQWRRENAIRLEENEKREKELRNKIIEEAIDFKNEFYEKRKLYIDGKRDSNREKEKVYLANQEKFHKEADKQYWKTIGEIIPREVPNIEKRGKKDKDKKPSITVIQGPKPGKPTDLSRMRHLLLKLKHTPPPHMVTPPPAPTKDAKDVKDGTTSKDGENVKNAAAGVEPSAPVKDVASTESNASDQETPAVAVEDPAN
ncbi:clathrin light chain 1-like [Apium graveolens]|uniref:clathrin light chain 1-like n=1 Tax=Apium graveolens TaxID=4045 RepID=UPI003D7B257F